MPSNDAGANGHASAVADTTGTRGSEAASEAAHALHRFDRDQLGGGQARVEQAGELAGAGGDVARPAPAADERVDDPLDRVRRVRRPGPLVRRGLGAEAGRGDVVDAQAGDAEGVQPWRPHSNLPLLDHRPARGSSPSFTGLVHGQQPIEG